MNMANEDFRNIVKDRHNFSQWAGKAKAFKGPLCKKFLPKIAEIKGLVLEKRRPIPEEKHAVIDYYHSTDDKDIRFAVTIFEYASVLDAHEGLVDMLSHCMAPVLPRASEKGIKAGDVAFGGHGQLQTDISFTRYNVLVRVESVGPKPASVKELAEKIDKQIIEHQKQ
jgi:hypothetical protein